MDNILIILSGLIYTNKIMYNQAYKLAHYLKGNVSIKTLQVIEEKDVENNDTIIFFEYPQSTGDDLREMWSRNIQDIDYLPMTDRK